jgi:4-amino-4-deoxy-L-arabinose transferase-like glycosyltransferase
VYIGGGYLVAAHLSGPTVYDALAWAAASYLIIRILRTGDERLWLGVGAVVGLGLEAKATILFLVFAVAVGFLVNRQARVLRSPWLWAGAAVALALWLPNLVWETVHGWPTFEMDANLRAEHSGLASVFTFPIIQLLLPNPFSPQFGSPASGRFGASRGSAPTAAFPWPTARCSCCSSW